MASFQSIHLRGVDARVVAGAVASSLAREGWRIAGEGGAERRIGLVDVDGGVALYDEWLHEDEDLDAFAARLSEAAGCAAVTVRIVHSDLVRVALFDRGRALDVYECGEEDEIRGDAARWSTVVGSGGAETLRSAFAGRSISGPENLAPIAAALGCALTDWCRGYGESLDADELGLVRADPVADEDEDAAPELEPYGGVRASGVAGRDAGIVLAHSNAGAASRGVEVTVWGSALDRGLLTVDRVVVGTESDPREAGLEGSEADDGSPLWLAELPDVRIPARVDPPGAPSPEAIRLAIEAQLRDRFEVRLVGRFLRPGRGLLRVAVRPLANEDGSCVHVVRVDVCEPPWLPPGVDRSERTEEHGAELAGDRMIQVLAVVRGPIGPAVAAAAAWWDAIRPHAVEGRLQGFAGHRTRRGAVGTDLATDPIVRDLAPIAGASVHLEAPSRSTFSCDWLDGEEDLDEDDLDELAAEGHPPAHGLQLEVADRDRAHVLALWFDRTGLPDAEVARLRGALDHVVDGLAAAGGLVQAVRSAAATWAPVGQMDQTPLEALLRRRSAVTRTIASNERRLRTIGPVVWLGPSFPDRELPAWERTRIGVAVRLATADDTPPERLFAALAPFLA